MATTDKHSIFASSVNIALICLLASCGGGGDSGGGDTPNPTPDPPPKSGFSVGGTIDGLPDNSSLLLVHGASSSTLLRNGAFVLNGNFETGAHYAVTIARSPLDRECTIADGEGTVNGSDVNNIKVDCSQIIPWVTDRPVATTATSEDGKLLFLGGEFTQVGRRTGAFVPVNSVNGEAQPYPSVEGIVNISISDGAGGWYLGGMFSKVGGLPKANLVRLLENGTVDLNFSPTTSAEVFSMVLVGNRLIIDNYNNNSKPDRVGLAALNAATGQIEEWIPEVSFARSLAAQGNVLYVGGNSTVTPATGYAALHAINLDTGKLIWSTEIDEQHSYDYSIKAMELYENKILIGGKFNKVDGKPRRCIAAINISDGKVSDWAPDIGDADRGCVIRAFLTHNTTLYVGGNFVQAGGKAHVGAVAVDLGNGMIMPWDPELSSSDIFFNDAAVYALTEVGGEIVLGGSFSKAGTRSVLNLAISNRTTGESRTWCLGGDAIRTLRTSGNSVWVGGQFSLLCGQPRQYLAALDTETGRLSPWNPKIDFYDSTGIQLILSKGSTVYLKGSFFKIDEASRQGFAALNSTTGSLLPFNPSFDNFGTIDGLTLGGDNLYVKGRFESIDGQPRSNLAAFSTRDGTLLPMRLQAGTNSNATDMVATNDEVYLIGDMTIEGRTRWGLRSVNTQTGAVQTLSTATIDALGKEFMGRRLALSGSTLYVFGSHYDVDNITRGSSAAFDTSIKQAIPWSPDTQNLAQIGSILSGPNNRLYLLSGPSLYTWDTTIHQFVGAPLNAYYGPNIDLGIRTTSLSQFGNQLCIVGAFEGFNGRDTSNIACFRAP